MSSDKRNMITDKATGLIFSLFNVASAREAYCSTYNAFFMDLPVSSFVSSFVSHSSLPTVKSVDLAIAHVASFHYRNHRYFS